MAETKQAKPLKVDLSDQVALVTGASQGIGRAIAETLAANGATVCVLARNQEKLASVVEAISSAGGKADAMPCDVSQPDAIEKVVETIVEKHGRLDILVNNAGVTRDTLLPRMSNDEWDEVLSTNLRAPFLFMRAVSRPMMQQRYGRIVNISSVSGMIGNPGKRFRNDRKPWASQLFSLEGGPYWAYPDGGERVGRPKGNSKCCCSWFHCQRHD